MAGAAAPSASTSASAAPAREVHAPLSGTPLIFATMLLALANFMAILDTTIVNVSVPTIAGGMAVSPGQGAWVITSYSVAEAIMVPLTGFLATRFGAVRVMTLSMAFFGLFSFLCGVAPDMGALVFFRVMQGLAGGPMMPMSQVLLMSIFPPEKRAQGLAIWMMTTLLGPVMGPIIGGTLSDTAGWRWAFFINVPVAMVVVPTVLAVFARRETPTRAARFDFGGIALLICWVGALQLTLDLGRDEGWFDSELIVGLVCVAVVGFAAFVIWELTERDPAVNLRVFRSRNFTAAAVLLAISFAVFFGTVVLIPLWLQTNQGYNAQWAGYAVALTGITAVATAPIAAKLVSRVDPRFLITFAIGWLTLMAWWRTQLPPDANFWAIAAPQLFQGVAMPMLFIPLNQMSLLELKPEELPGGAGLVTFMRTMAAAFSTAIVTSAWDSAQSLHRSELSGFMTPGHPAYDQAVAAARGLTGSDAGTLAMMDRILQGQAVMVATSHMFALSVVALLSVIPLIWLMRRPRPGEMAGASPGGH